MANDNLESLRKQLKDFVIIFQQQGILNEFFDISYHKLKENVPDKPNNFIDTASTFCFNAEIILNDLNKEMDLSNLDFYVVSEHHVKLKGSSSWLGFQGILLGCADLAKAICDQSRERCILAVQRLNHEFQIAKDILAIIVDLERRIVSHNTGDP